MDEIQRRMANLERLQKELHWATEVLNYPEKHLPLEKFPQRDELLVQLRKIVEGILNEPLQTANPIPDPPEPGEDLDEIFILRSSNRNEPLETTTPIEPGKDEDKSASKDS